MNNMAKRYGVFSQLNRRGIHIAMLQETRLTLQEGQALQKRWRGQLYYTSYSAYTQGILIWVKPGVLFQVTGSMADPDSRFLAVSERLTGREITLLSVCAPNIEQGTFLGTLFNKLADFLVQPLIMGGDFNCVAEIALDHSHPPLRDSPAHTTARNFRDWKTRWDLIDIWRTLHPLERDYLFF